MAPNTTRNAGRQLLVTRNRLRTEKNSLKIASLKHLEANLLLELGQKDAAVAVATSLVERNPEESRERAFLGDMLARSFSWLDAEKEFVEAHRLCLANGKAEKAFSLAAGPLFLLAEARGDHTRCFEIAPMDVLRNRAIRLSGGKLLKKPVPYVVPSVSPWREIAILEKVLNGGNPHVLVDLLAHWNCGEAEWRWRILFEGAASAIGAGLSTKPWKKYMKQTGAKVLDPRYFIERRDLKQLLNRGFVNS
ncbi:MAG: hypothetical protein KAH54_08940 [Candidatus Sabulitectum sp.]|nr:hypothetical protein [Candidatus Sabulitectum sp.]